MPHPCGSSLQSFGDVHYCAITRDRGVKWLARGLAVFVCQQVLGCVAVAVGLVLHLTGRECIEDLSTSAKAGHPRFLTEGRIATHGGIGASTED